MKQGSESQTVDQREGDFTDNSLLVCNTKSWFSHLSKGHSIASFVLHTSVLCCIHEKHGTPPFHWTCFGWLIGLDTMTTIILHPANPGSQPWKDTLIPIEDIFHSWIFF
jgi:hypothetical protein